MKMPLKITSIFLNILGFVVFFLTCMIFNHVKHDDFFINLMIFILPAFGLVCLYRTIYKKYPQIHRSVVINLSFVLISIDCYLRASNVFSPSDFMMFSIFLCCISVFYAKRFPVCSSNRKA